MAEKDDRTASAAESKATPIIRLEAIAGPGAYVEIDGEPYAMAAPASLGLIERTRVVRLLERIFKLEQLEEPSADEATEYEGHLRSLAPLILPGAKSETLERLAIGQLADLAVAFFVHAAKTSPRIAMLLGDRTTSPTGTSSSPDSSASTAAATPGAGS